jgi:hypothetical protein
MKTNIQSLLTGLAIFASINHVAAQGTAFTYQGRLNVGTNAASGKYDLAFSLFNASSGGSQRGVAFTNTATTVANGLFMVTLNFGTGIFTSTNLWLDVRVRTNGSGAFTTLSPRQQITPTPYAIFANTASNVSGTVSAAQLSGTIPAVQLGGTVANGQLANSSIIVNHGPGLSGGGTIALGGSTTLTNAGVLAVAGSSNITASTVSGTVTLGDTATSANTVNRIVKRDASGNFSAGTITGNLTGNATTATTAMAANNFSGSLSGDVTGTQSATVVSSIGGQTAANVARSVSLLHTVGTDNFFAGVGAGNLTMSHGGNVGIGSQVLCQNTTGFFNTAGGAYSLSSNTTGDNNTAFGDQALSSNTTGDNNTAYGYAALKANTSGINNVAIGEVALVNNTSGSNNGCAAQLVGDGSLDFR